MIAWWHLGRGNVDPARSHEWLYAFGQVHCRILEVSDFHRARIDLCATMGLEPKLDMHRRMRAVLVCRRQNQDNLGTAGDPGSKGHVGNRGNGECCLLLTDEHHLARARLGKNWRGEDHRQSNCNSRAAPRRASSALAHQAPRPPGHRRGPVRIPGMGVENSQDDQRCKGIDEQDLKSTSRANSPAPSAHCAPPSPMMLYGAQNNGWA